MARKEKTIHYIYKTTCKVTGRYYIGMHSTCDLEDGYMGSGRRLRRSIRKHGEENHIKEILEFLPDRYKLVEAEKKAITSDILKDDKCMNLMTGGEGGFISEEQQRHRSECAGNAHAKKLKNDLNYRNKFIKRVSKEMKKRHEEGKIKYDTFTGKSHSKETIELMKLSHKDKHIGNKNSQYGTCWITKEGINKKIKKTELKNYIKKGWIKGRTWER